MFDVSSKLFFYAKLKKSLLPERKKHNLFIFTKTDTTF